jgi:hypothetical protein
MKTLGCMIAAVLMAAPGTLVAQRPAILGTWKFDIRQGDRKGPQMVIVRADSSASYGTETVRWRVVGDSLALALGGEWVNYRVKLKGKRLTLSGGDLTEPVSFERVGPPSPRPDSIPVPPDPEQVPG